MNMKIKLLGLVVVGVVALAAALTLMPSAWSSPTAQADDNDKNGSRGRDISDHALKNVSDAAVACRSNKAFTVYISVVALTAPATLRVTFAGDNTATDSISYPLLVAGQTVNITQAAGGTPAVDGKIVVAVSGGTAVSWMSLMTQSGAKGFDGGKVDYCRTYGPGQEHGGTTEADAISDT